MHGSCISPSNASLEAVSINNSLPGNLVRNSARYQEKRGLTSKNEVSSIFT